MCEYRELLQTSLAHINETRCTRYSETNEIHIAESFNDSTATIKTIIIEVSKTTKNYEPFHRKGSNVSGLSTIWQRIFF